MPLLILEASVTPKFEKHKTRKSRQTAELCYASRPTPIRTPLSPHRVLLRVRRGPCRQKQLHHRRMTFLRSDMQRRLSTLRRVAALRQAALSSARVRAPPLAPHDPLYHTSSGATAEKKTA